MKQCFIVKLKLIERGAFLAELFLKTTSEFKSTVKPLQTMNLNQTRRNLSL